MGTFCEASDDALNSVCGSQSQTRPSVPAGAAAVAAPGKKEIAEMLRLAKEEVRQLKQLVADRQGSDARGGDPIGS